MRNLLWAPQYTQRNPLFNDMGVYVLNPYHPLSRGLVGWWLSNEGAGWRLHDCSGNRRNGTITNGSWDYGQYGSGLKCPGTCTVDLGNISAMDGLAACTASVRVKPISLSSPGGYQSYFDKTGGVYATGYLGWRILTGAAGSTAEVGFETQDGAPNTDRYGFTSAKVLSEGVWATVTVVFDGSLTSNANRLKFYINGLQVTAAFTGNAIPAAIVGATSEIATIGSDQHSSAYANAVLDDVRFYNRALSAAEVMELHRFPFGTLTSPVFLPMGLMRGILTKSTQGITYNSPFPSHRQAA